MKTIPNIIPVYGVQDVDALDMTEGELAVTTASGYPVIVGGFTDTNGDAIKVPLTSGAAEAITVKPTITIPLEGVMIDNNAPMVLNFSTINRPIDTLVYQVSFDSSFTSVMLKGRFHVVHAYATEGNPNEWNVDSLLKDLRKIVSRYDGGWMKSGGTLYYRVAGVDTDGVVGIYSDVRSVTISSEASTVTPITVGTPGAQRHDKVPSNPYYSYNTFSSVEGLGLNGKYFDVPILNMGVQFGVFIDQATGDNGMFIKPATARWMAPIIDASVVRAPDYTQGSNHLYGVVAGCIALNNTDEWSVQVKLGTPVTFFHDIGTRGVAMCASSVTLTTTGTEPNVVNSTRHVFEIFYADADGKIMQGMIVVEHDDVNGINSAAVTEVKEYFLGYGGNVVLEPGERILASSRVKAGLGSSPTIITNKRIFADNRYPSAFFTYNEENLPVTYVKINTGGKTAVVQFDIPGHGARVIKLQSNDVAVRVADYWLGDRTATGYTADYEVVDSVVYDHGVEDHDSSTLFLIVRPKGSTDFLSNEMRAARYDPAYGFVNVSSAALPEKPVVLSRSINQSLATDYVTPTVLYGINEQVEEYQTGYNFAVATLV